MTVAAAPRDSLLDVEHRQRPLKDIARQILDAERTARARVHTDLIRSHEVEIAAIRQIEVGLRGLQLIAAWKLTLVSTARRALPLALAAQTRSGQAAALVEPGGVGGGFV